MQQHSPSPPTSTGGFFYVPKTSDFDPSRQCGPAACHKLALNLLWHPDSIGPYQLTPNHPGAATMGRTFAYCRVSTTEQTTDNQILAIQAKGYTIEPQRVIAETISGSVCAMQRPAFAALVNHKLEAGDQLIVLKLDRLGRDSIDVQQTVKMLMGRGVDIVCLDLPNPDLSSAGGVLMLQMFSAFAEWERNRIIERTREGLARARKEGRTGGRPKAATPADVQACKAEGLTQTATADRLGVSVRTVKRSWNQAAE